MRILLSVTLLFSVIAQGVQPVAAARTQTVYLADYPLLKQQHPLTCESSAASMGTRGVVSESQLMALIPRNPDPNLGFRGNPNNHQKPDLRDYGVYAAPVSRALAHFGWTAKPLYDASDEAIRQYLQRGWPLVVWITYALWRETPKWVIENDHGFVLVPHEHTVLVVGYDSQGLVANDPWTAQQVRYRWADFNRSWAYLGRMALPIQPCTAPSPVTNVGITRHGRTIIWTWSRSPRARRYQVTLLQYTGHTHWKVISSSRQTGTAYATRVSSSKGTYDLQILALAACGASGNPVDSISQPPAPPPTPTPSPTVTPSPTPTATATATPAPSPSATSGTPGPTSTVPATRTQTP